MTHEEWAALTPEQQRVKVACLCGWTRIVVDKDWLRPFEDYTCTALVGMPAGSTWVGSASLDEVPDYLVDLNAMHEAEKLLGLTPKDRGWGTYTAHLHAIFTGSLDGYSHIIWHATAAQRAEAFVRTMIISDKLPNINAQLFDRKLQDEHDEKFGDK